MAGNSPKWANTAALLAIPVIVAVFDLSLAATLVLLAVALVWRWASTLSGLAAPREPGPLVLDTIAASHFAEKVRWCLDRLGVPYVENQSVGVMGVVFTGRTVPRLRFRTGVVESSLGNSPEILRFLWGAYGADDGDRARFLEPTPQRIEMEKQLERYGVNLQVWIYWHLLEHRELTLHAWGADSTGAPRWQRRAVRLIYPLLAGFVRRAFRIDRDHYERAARRIDELLGDIDTRLADGRTSILGEGAADFVDITFAAMSGLWLQPPGYGGGRAEECRLARELLPAGMRKDIDTWSEDHPRAVAFVERLYAEERMRGTNVADAGQTPAGPVP